MILYSIYPHDVVFPEKEEERSYFTVDLDGRTFVLELQNGEARIVRLVSANPDDYLNPQWQPGTRVTFSLPGSPYRD